VKIEIFKNSKMRFLKMHRNALLHLCAEEIPYQNIVF